MTKFTQNGYSNQRSCYCTSEEAHEYIRKHVKYDGAYRMVNSNGNTMTMTYQRGSKLVARIIYRNPDDVSHGATLQLFK